VEALFERVRQVAKPAPARMQVPAAVVRKLAGTDTSQPPVAPSQRARRRATKRRASSRQRKVAKRTTRKRAAR
jgi:hypothetical protein